MTDSEIIDRINKVKASAKKNSIIIIAAAVLVIFIFILITKVFSGNSNKEIRDLKADNKRLREQMDSLKGRFSSDSIERAIIISVQEAERVERNRLANEIRNYSNQLSKFKQQYADIPKYNVPADSLLRIFNQRFDY